MAKIILVTLPIGNKLDLTKRAAECLSVARVVFSEDTRVFKSQMERFEISTIDMRINSFHDHSDNKKLGQIFKYIEKGEDVYFTSDAGSPIISDPAFPLIREAIDRGVEIETVTGVSAVLCALELSGLPPHPFTFHGFLSREKGKNESFFKENIERGGTHICFESPNRILKSVEILSKLGNDFDITVARELTKPFQAVHRFKAKEFLNVKDDIVCKGEFVLLFHSKASENKAIDSEVVKLVDEYLHGKRSTKKLAKIFAKVTGNDIKDTYGLLSE